MRKRVGLFHYAVEVRDAAGQHLERRIPLVDTGALYSQFLASFLDRLGHRPDANRTFQLGDGTLIERRIGDVPLRINDEVRTVTCVFGEEGSLELLGATTMEAFSLAPDPVNETLIPVIALLA
jgi:predicted aspartyl protease